MNIMLKHYVDHNALNILRTDLLFYYNFEHFYVLSLKLLWNDKHQRTQEYKI